MSDTMIRVVLIDDHPALRMGLRIVLEQAPGVQVVAEAGSGQEALALIQALRPDVAVLDCQLPDMPGSQAAAELRRLGLATRVLALERLHRRRGHPGHGRGRRSGLSAQGRGAGCHRRCRAGRRARRRTLERGCSVAAGRVGCSSCGERGER
ncbi:MAG: response regulator transcription factor [Anaerolineae bacterium]